MEPICLQGRTLASDDLASIRALIAEHPDWHRTAISRRLCELWNWRNAAGQLKDMAARTLLLKLQARSLIELPAPQGRNNNAHRCARPPSLAQSELGSPAPQPIKGPLQALQPLRLELASEPALRRRAAWLLRHHHYQGFSGAVGENVQYLIYDVHGRELAVMVFGAAAWKIADRDRYIGWSPAQRQQGLSGIANQQRFLILPWVQAPHLASHMLGLAVRRLPQDWLHRYGHRVWLAETFVEEERFKGTAYKAAGWLRAGQTAGRTRQDRHHTMRAPIKSVWLKPLHPQFRQHLCRQ